MSAPASTGNPHPPSRILAVRLQGLGDTLMTTPALRAARAAWPEARLVMLVGRAAAPAVEGNPHLDRVVTVDEGIFFGPRPWPLLRLAWGLRRERFDLGLVFSRSRALRAWVRLAGAGSVVGHLRPPADPGSPREDDWKRATYEALEHLSLVTGLGAEPQGQQMQLNVTGASQARAEAILSRGRASGWLVLAPGGGENAAWRMLQKRWPVGRFADLATAARERWGMGAVVVGGDGDRELARRIRARASAPVLDATAEPLGVSTGIIARARLLVTNDSVAMHLGVLTAAPTVALFGPTNPRAVLPAEGAFRVVRPEVPCGPCFWQAKPGIRPSRGRGNQAPCSRHAVSCLEDVGLAPVIAAAEDLLAEGPPR